MRMSELKDLAPEIEKRIDLSSERAKDIRRKIRMTDRVNAWASEFYQRLMDDALVHQEEAWDECAQLFGFKDLDDSLSQNYSMVLNGSQLELRKIKVP